jgi:hypothetical protein
MAKGKSSQGKNVKAKSSKKDPGSVESQVRPRLKPLDFPIPQIRPDSVPMHVLPDLNTSQSLVKDAAVLLPPMERVEAVRSHWEVLSEAERADMLSVDIIDLRASAAEVAQSARASTSG